MSLLLLLLLALLSSWSSNPWTPRYRQEPEEAEKEARQAEQLYRNAGGHEGEWERRSGKVGHWILFESWFTPHRCGENLNP